MKKALAIVALLTTMVILLTACGSTNQQSKTKNTTTAKATAAPTATLDPSLKENTVNITISLTTGEEIKAELYPDIAPITVENFVKLVNENFYDGLIFHRVIPGFMIQGGGYTADMQEKKADTIKGEFSENGVKNDLKHTRGVLSMARTQVKDSASSQFFIMHADAPHLDGQYAAFGMVTEGLDVVDKIASAKTQSDPATHMENIPVEPIVIQTITID